MLGKLRIVWLIKLIELIDKIYGAAAESRKKILLFCICYLKLTLNSEENVLLFISSEAAVKDRLLGESIFIF